MEYMNGKNIVFLFKKGCMINQFYVRVYDVLQINLNEYSIMMNTILKSSCSTQHVCLLPINLFDDEMVKVILYMRFNLVNYECICIFVITFFRVTTSPSVSFLFPEVLQLMTYWSNIINVGWLHKMKMIPFGGHNLG